MGGAKHAKCTRKLTEQALQDLIGNVIIRVTAQETATGKKKAVKFKHRRRHGYRRIHRQGKRTRHQAHLGWMLIAEAETTGQTPVLLPSLLAQPGCPPVPPCAGSPPLWTRWLLSPAWPLLSPDPMAEQSQLAKEEKRREEKRREEKRREEKRREEKRKVCVCVCAHKGE